MPPCRLHPVRRRGRFHARLPRPPGELHDWSAAHAVLGPRSRWRLERYNWSAARAATGLVGQSRRTVPYDWSGGPWAVRPRSRWKRTWEAIMAWPPGAILCMVLGAAAIAAIAALVTFLTTTLPRQSEVEFLPRPAGANPYKLTRQRNFAERRAADFRRVDSEAVNLRQQLRGAAEARASRRASNNRGSGSARYSGGRSCWTRGAISGALEVVADVEVGGPWGSLRAGR